MARTILARLDPRVAAVTHPGRVVGVSFLLFFLFGTYGNWRVLDLRGGILDDALPKDNAYRQRQEYVQTKEGFRPQEIVPIIMKVPGADPAALHKVVELTQAAKQAFGGGVLSLAELPNYRDAGDTLLDSPYLSRETLGHFNEAEWKARVAQDAAARGVLVDRHWQWTAVMRFLPPGYSEIQEAWRIIELLEGRSIPWWERLFFKADIHPQDPSVGVSGWVMGRWQIDQGLNRDMLLLPTLGLLLSFLILWRSLGSRRQALIAVSVNIVGGIWLTRACIWPLHDAGTGIFERVYTVVAYANVIVQGISFSLHKLQRFREAPGLTTQEKFLHAREVDKEIGLVAVIAIAAFLCLKTFPIWQMREMGYQSAVGVMVVLIGATIFIPAFYLFLERLLGPERAVITPTAAEGTRGHWLIRLRVPTWVAVGIPILTFAAAAWLFFSGKIETRTTPVDYVKGTLVGKTYQFLARSGNEFLDLLVEPRAGDIYQPAFIQEAWNLQRDLTPQGETAHPESGFERWQRTKGLTPVLGVKEVGSVLGKVRQIAQESYRKELPKTPAEVEDAFFLVEDGIDPEVNRQMWFSGGVRFVAAAVMDDTVEFRALVERVLQFAAETYPTLKVTPFGKVLNYPQMDLYIANGEASNIITSLIVVFGLYLCWLLWQNGRGGRPPGPVLSPVRGALILLLPFLFGVGTVGILLWYLGVPLSMSTAPFADLAVNASGDFGIYVMVAFLAGLHQGHGPRAATGYALATEGAVVLTDCLLNGIAFLPLLASQFQPVREIGWLMGFMLVACGVGALVFVPSVLPLAVKRRPASQEVLGYEEALHV